MGNGQRCRLQTLDRRAIYICAGTRMRFPSAHDPAPAIWPVELLTQTAAVCHPVFKQHAKLRAFRDSKLDRHRLSLARHRPKSPNFGLSIPSALPNHRADAVRALSPHCRINFTSGRARFSGTRFALQPVRGSKTTILISGHPDNCVRCYGSLNAKGDDLCVEIRTTTA